MLYCFDNCFSNTTENHLINCHLNTILDDIIKDILKYRFINQNLKNNESVIKDYDKLILINKEEYWNYFYDGNYGLLNYFYTL